MIALEKAAALTTAETQKKLIIPRWLKVASAIGYSGIGRTQMYTLFNSGAVRSHLIGTSRLVDRESLDAYIASQPGCVKKAA